MITLKVKADQALLPGMRASGLVYNDDLTSGNHPFPDGTPVLTSSIQSIKASGDSDWLLVTRNTTYKLEIIE